MRMDPADRRACGLFATAIALSIVLAGCSNNDTPTAPGGALTQYDADDVAVQAGIALNDLRAVIEVAGGSATRPPAGGAGAFTLDGAHAGSATLSDTSFTRGRLIFELSRSWFALDGAPQAAPDAMTDSLAVHSRIFGADSTARYMVALGHEGQIGLGGLNVARDEFRLGGAAADTLSSKFEAMSGMATRYCFGRTATTIADVRWPKAAMYPASGTITLVVDAVRYRDGTRATVERTLHATVVVTFNGTRHPGVAVEGTWHYTWDLETGAIEPMITLS